MNRHLNLGCGQFKLPEATNVDWDEAVQPDICHNLNQTPYPFDDNSFDRITMHHCLEHLETPFSIMRELHRIASPEALIDIRVPHFSRGFTHAEHRHGFDVTFPLYFDPTFKGGYTGCHFQLAGLKLEWFAQPTLKKQTLGNLSYGLGKLASYPLNLLANLSPVMCSRLWCFWVGGFEEIQFNFIVKK